MNKKIFLSVIFGSACLLSASGQNLFVDAFPHQPKITKGMFDTYEVDSKMYWSIPDSLFDREYAVTNTILQAPENPNRNMENKYGYAGDLIGPMFFTLHKEGKEVCLADPQHKKLIAAPESEMGKLMMLDPQERLYKRMPILLEKQGHTLIEIGSTLKNFTLFAMEPAYYDMRISMRNKDRDRILEVKGKPDCLLLRLSRTYQNMAAMQRGKQAPSYQGIWENGLCISVMPKQPIAMKRGDSKSFFEIGKNVVDAEGKMSRMPIIKRWRLEIRPEDRERYRRGELVEPVKPIIFYVDRNFPKMYQKCIIEAVREWIPAFEQAGFKNAIDARLAPTPEEAADFCMYDSSYPYISWKVSGMNNAYGPTPCEGRAAEIMGCHVAVFSSVLNVVQNWYFAQCGAVDPEARKIILPESLQCELLKLVITHEIGHSLGLEHNYTGSYMASLDQLRDNDYLSKHSLGSSIMDYVRFNYALRPGDKVDFRNRRIQLGAYDRWAIEWGYREFEGDTPEEQEAVRWKWYEEQKKTRPELMFCDGRDIRSQQEDLGNDHVAINTCGVNNLKYLCSLNIWKPKNSLEEQVMVGRYKALVEHYKLWTGHVFAHLGGFYWEKLKKVSDTEEYMSKVRQFLEDEVVKVPTWLFDQKLLDGLHLDALQEMKAVCDEQDLHFQSALRRMKDAKATAEEMDAVKAMQEAMQEAYKALGVPMKDGNNHN